MKSTSGVRNQVFATCVINVINLSHGAGLGWVSPYLPVLMDENQTLLETGPVTVEQGSWIGSILCLGGLCGAFTYSYLVEKLGIKKSIQALAIPHSAFWIIVYLATSVYHLYIARFMAGLAGGGIIVTFPLYVADISDKRIRGILGTFLALMNNLGILLMYVIGNVLSYHTVVFVMLVLPALFTGLMFLIPDTPQTLLKQGKVSEAERSLMFYQGVQDAVVGKSPAFRQEFDNMRKFIECSIQGNSRVTVADFRTREAKLGMLIGVFLMFVNQFCGIFAVLTYAAYIFATVGSTLSPNTSTIIMGTVQIFGTLSSFVFIDLIGRKVLLAISTFGIGMGLLLLAAFNWMTITGVEWVYEFQWLPIVILSATVFLYAVGLSSIPFFVLPELLPAKVSRFLVQFVERFFMSRYACPQICNAGNTLSMVTVTIFSFISLKIFPVMVEVIHLYGAIGIYSGICFVGGTIFLFIIPETKGKSLIATPTLEKRLDDKATMALRPAVGHTGPRLWLVQLPRVVSPRDLVMHPLTFASIRNQFLGTFAVNIIALAHGGVLGWVSPSLAYLQSNGTHLAGGPLTVEQTSWLGSSLCIGGMIGVTLFGLLADYVGKRRALQCITVPHVAFWLCVLFGSDVYQLCLGRVFAGAAGGGLIRIVPLYVAEIADCRIRGALGSLLPICFNAGTVLAFIVGGLVSFETMPLVLLVLPALFLLAMIVLPDTPACLLRSMRNEQAERSLMFYRGVAGHFQKTDQFRLEFQQLSVAIEREKTEPDAGISWKDFASGPGRRGLAMAMFLMFLNQCSGSLALITYAATIFEMATSGHDAYQLLPPSIAPIVLATVQLIGTIVPLLLVDRVGRRILLIVSCVGVANGYLTLAAYVQFRPQEATTGALGGSTIAVLLPLVSLSFSILLASLGLLTVPFVVMAEILPAKLRNVGSTICMTIVAVCAFALLKLFPPLLATVGLPGTMSLLAMVCLVGAMLITGFLPETKGKPLLAGTVSESEPSQRTN
ncbi:uncharacterized protein LOC126576447 [Anopheles aquasalis]|uniref:uncharacterized protein LOC126576447 n=1 Tax=Anopheles aquasalis TaxID=42839 RepID=UPI00215A2974|nr:uncharacterized protein LOC126576447 [Anopheles aquasalis]